MYFLIHFFSFDCIIKIRESDVMIELKEVSKKYKSNTILDEISLTIEDGELVTLIGESGCGKTTTLKMLNKLITPTSGEIYIDGVNIKELNDIDLKRNMGYVIQQTGLFPHMTIKEIGRASCRERV